MSIKKEFKLTKVNDFRVTVRDDHLEVSYNDVVVTRQYSTNEQLKLLVPILIGEAQTVLAAIQKTKERVKAQQAIADEVFESLKEPYLKED